MSIQRDARLRSSPYLKCVVTACRYRASVYVRRKLEAIEQNAAPAPDALDVRGVRPTHCKHARVPLPPAHGACACLR
ncbi:hypothetical protein EON67_08835 [archaeon]|nr:MAG: hypothetical protein EON67_08835 [archaeon]